MTVPGNIDALLLGGQRGYQIERSLRFNSADSAYLNRTYSGACLDAKLMTISVWVKRGKLTTAGQQPIFSSYSAVRFGGDLTWTAADKIQFRPGGNGDGASNQYSISTDAVFRDPSAWYHIVIQYDSTQATSTNRQKIYVNGVQQTVTGNYPTQNYLHTYAFNNANNQIGAYTSYGTDYLDSYLTEFHFIDGQALTPSSFGETDTITGVWKPKKYAGTYGTNGFYLKFADNSGTTSTTLGKDSSGNGNNWTPNNFSVTAGAGNDSMIDTPTPYADGGNGRGNYCTLNPLAYDSSTYTLSNGSLEFSAARTASGTWYIRSTQSIATGKWYWEVTPTNVGGGPNLMVGIQDTTTSAVTGSTNTALNGYGYGADGAKYNNAGYTNGYGATYAANDVVGVAFDADAGIIVFYKNGTSQGTAFSSITGTFSPTVMMSTAGVARTVAGSINFGQRAFAYTPPSGFKALNTQNLPEPSIKKPSSYMDVSLYTGNGGSAVTTVTNSGFQPGLVWLKARSSAYDHKLVDVVRGASGGIYYDLQSNSTGAESLPTAGITSLTSSGFTISAAANNGYNGNGTTFVAWQWAKSATPGFDIVTYTGNGTNRTIAHSLGVAPSMIIVKDRTSGTANWVAGHTSIGWGNRLYLNDTSASTAAATTWNSTAPTSSVFSVGTSTQTNANGDNHVAYLWSEVAGMSKFGSYTGNGSSDGPFVFCGFRPRWVLIKRSDSANDWYLHDTARSDYNVATKTLNPNSSAAEVTLYNYIDVLSNGFKCRTADGASNANGGTYVFAAFSESAFKYSLAR